MDLWAGKIERDDIRKELENTNFRQSLCTLYFYDGEKKKPIDQSFLVNEYSSGFAHANDTPVLIYPAVDFEKIPKFKMSEIINLEDLFEKIEQEIDDATVRRLAVQNTTSVVGYGTNARYIMMNAAPPLVPTKYGNLHKLPNPTAEPAIATRIPKPLPKLSLLAITQYIK
jgi:hypothetical protein